MSEALVHEDVVLENIPPSAQWNAVAQQRLNGPTGLWLVVAPHDKHPVMSGGEGLRVTHIVPEMTDDARRNTAQSLRSREVDVLFVTTERFAQEKFLGFLAELAPAKIVVASAEGCVASARETRSTFAPLGVLRDYLQSTPKLVLTENSGDVRKLTAFLGLNCRSVDKSPPEKKTHCREESKGPPVNPAWTQAFRCFAEGMPLAEVAQTLQLDEEWCLDALLGYIESERRTNPFPWVSQPDYLVVAMAAGQAETTDSTILLPILADRVAPEAARIALASLRNRSLDRPRP